MVLRNLREDGVGGEARVGRARKQEAQVLLRRRLMRWRCRVDRRHVARAQPHAGGVAHRAVDADPRKTNRHLREPDRHLVACWSEHADGRVPAGLRDVLGKDARQHQPDPVRHALPLLGADRSVQEVLLVRREVRRRFPPEELHVRNARRQTAQHDSGRHQEASQRAREQPGEPARIEESVTVSMQETPGVTTAGRRRQRPAAERAGPLPSGARGGWQAPAEPLPARRRRDPPRRACGSRLTV